MKLAPTVRQHFPLAHRKKALMWIRKAIHTYRRDAAPRRASSRPTVSEQRPQLLKIAAHSEKLAGLLDALTAAVAIQLSPKMTDPQLDQVTKSLRHLHAASKRAHQALAVAGKRAPKDQAFDSLLSNLIIAWSRAHPKDHGVTRNSDTYHGALLDFTREVLDCEQIPHTSGLGKRLYNFDLPFRSLPGETEHPRKK
jgi:hypothetical protein